MQLQLKLVFQNIIPTFEKGYIHNVKMTKTSFSAVLSAA